MKDTDKAYFEIVDFLQNADSKSLLLKGISDDAKVQLMLKSLHDEKLLRGSVYLMHMKKDGIEKFFRPFNIPGRKKIAQSKTYGEEIRFSDMQLRFYKLKSYTDFLINEGQMDSFSIVWPIQSAVGNREDIANLKKYIGSADVKKIILITYNVVLQDTEEIESIVDKVIKLDKENDDPKVYNRRIETAKYNDIRKTALSGERW
ncbi:MAG: hypothetical protein PHS94_07045 [Erysipelotrichaceae bacterium]|nr:hypothetical protein [Erysipelotrichaceae bacterium]